MFYSLNYKLKEPQDSDYFELDDFNYNTELIDTELKRLSQRGIGGSAFEYIVTLYADSWESNNGIYQQPISIEGISSSTKICLKLPLNLTSAEYNNVVNSIISISSIGTDTIIFNALGIRPAMDIKLNIVVLGATGINPDPPTPGPGPGPTPEPPTIVTWSDGTDEEIQAMITASDAGIIDLAEYWHIGDERQLTLSAMGGIDENENHPSQTTSFVIVALDTKVDNMSNPCYNYRYVNKTSTRTYPSAIVQQKNCLNERNKMNTARTTANGWTDAPRRIWCNETYKSAIPSSIVDIFKQVKVKCSESYPSSSQLTYTNDYFFFPTSFEVVGESSTYGRSNPCEYQNLSVLPYYQTVENRTKTYTENGVAYNTSWLTRSVVSGNSISYVSITSSGSVVNSFADSNSCGIAPAGCI